MRQFVLSTALIGMILSSAPATMLGQNELRADFSSKESIKTSYKQGFDDADSFQDWTLSVTNRDKSWKLDNPRKSGVPNFSSINPTSKYSLSIRYDDYTRQDERFTSPIMTIAPHSSCNFYACFDGVYTASYYANFTIEVINAVTKENQILFDAGKWSQETGHERHKWLYFDYSLEQYANQQVQFVFHYVGMGGDDVLVDDFTIIEQGGNQAAILEGQAVHFSDLSVGQPTSWLWAFEGGNPTSSTQQSPEVVYNKAGVYPVTLEVTDAQGNQHSTTVEQYVRVTGVAPIAKIGLPQQGYLSPYAGIFLPPNTPIDLSDRSEHVPTSWKWMLPGANPASSTEQNPTIQYAEAGRYDISLQVSNTQGSDLIDYQQYIQIGDSLEIWNIELEEANHIQALSLGAFFGYYGGSNWLGMQAFAECFDRPITAGSISEVSIFFDKTETVSPNTPIQVSIALPDKQGLPGTIVATSSLLVKELVNIAGEWAPTIFKFNSPVAVADSFFVIVAGIPNHIDETTYKDDQVAIAAVPVRAKGGKSTTFHLLEEWDANDKPTGNYSWFKNDGEPTSLAIAPRFSYSTPSSVIEIETAASVDLCYTRDNRIYFTSDKRIDQVQILDITGVSHHQSANASVISTESWSHGVYIVKVVIDGATHIQKIQL